MSYNLTTMLSIAHGMGLPAMKDIRRLEVAFAHHPKSGNIFFLHDESVQ